jgi:hypothetical protein
VRDVRVEVSGGGGNGNNDGGCPVTQYSGGIGAYAGALVSNVPPTVAVTVGAVAGASSFGPFVTCTGGANATTGGSGASGSATVAGGVLLDTTTPPFFRGASAVPGASGGTSGFSGIGFGANGTNNVGAGRAGVVTVEWVETIP